MGDNMKKGYRIVYDHDKESYSLNRAVSFLKRMGFLSVLFTLVLLIALCPSFSSWVKDVLIPGDDQVTILAVDRFAQSLTQSGSLLEAVDAFCHTIIDVEE